MYTELLWGCALTGQTSEVISTLLAQELVQSSFKLYPARLPDIRDEGRDAFQMAVLEKTFSDIPMFINAKINKRLIEVIEYHYVVNTDIIVSFP